MRTIICGVDGSHSARVALRVAAGLATELDARLVAVHVLDRVADIEASAERTAANLLCDEIPDIAAEARGEVGDVAERLAAVARNKDAMMIVLGARSRGRSPSFLRARCSGELGGLTSVPVAATPTTPMNTAISSGGPDDSRSDANPLAGARVADQPEQTFAPQTFTAPVVAAVDGSAASTAALDTAVRLAAEINTPLVFVYVRRGPAGFFGTPVYQRRLTAAMAKARRVLDRALWAAARAGVTAESEILEGAPGKRILEFARDRGARLVVVGRRRRRFGRSVSSAVIRTAGRPVVVAQGGRIVEAATSASHRVAAPSRIAIGLVSHTDEVQPQ
jgi:nucleotide-binding universal stress UspA family protein